MSPRTTSRPGMRRWAPPRMTSARGLDEVAQGIERPLRAAFLDDGDRHDDENEAQEHQRIARFAHEEVKTACGDEHEKHRLADDLQGNGGEPALLLRGEFVRPVLLESPAGVVFTEARETAEVQVRGAAARWGGRGAQRVRCCVAHAAFVRLAAGNRFGSE